MPLPQLKESGGVEAKDSLEETVNMMALAKLLSRAERSLRNESPMRETDMSLGRLQG